MRQLARIFISYSRSDADTAFRIHDRLIELGHEVQIDKSGILPMEDIRERLSAMIQSSDAVVLLLSQSWLNSRSCQWECKFAHDLNKRFVPIALEDVGKDLPPEITRIHYLPLYDGLHFDDVIEQAQRSFDVNLEWVREHTRIGELADRWKNAAGMPLHGRELRVAQNWLKTLPHADAPEPTAAQYDFIKASKIRQLCWRLFYSALGIAALIATAAIIYIENERTIDNKRAQLIELWRERAQEAADKVHTETEEAVILALEVWLSARSEPEYIPDSIYETLAYAIPMLRERVYIETGPDPIVDSVFTETGDHFLVQSSNGDILAFDRFDGSSAPPRELSELSSNTPFIDVRGSNLRLVEPISQEPIGAPIALPEGFSATALSPDAETIAIGTADGSVSFFSISSGKSVFDPLTKFDTKIVDLVFLDDKNALMIAEEQRVHFINIETGQELSKPLELPDHITSLTVSDDQRLIAVATQNVTRVWERTPSGPVEIVAPIDPFGTKEFNTEFLSFSPDNMHLLIAGNHKQARLRIYNLETEAQTLSMDWRDDPITLATYTPDGSHIIFGTQSARITVLSASMGSQIRLPENAEEVIRNSTAPASTVEEFLSLEENRGQIHFDQSHIAVLLTPDNPITHNETLNHNGNSISSIAISPDGRLLVSATTNGSIHVWDRETAQQVTQTTHLRGSGGVNSSRLYVDFADDGQTVLSWWNDTDIRAWNVALSGSTLMQSACLSLPFKNGRQEPISGTLSRTQEAPPDFNQCDRFDSHHFTSH